LLSDWGLLFPSGQISVRGGISGISTDSVGLGLLILSLLGFMVIWLLLLLNL
jgi:hypothetical protein